MRQRVSGAEARRLPRRRSEVVASAAGVLVVLMCPSPVESGGYLGETPRRETTPDRGVVARQVSEISTPYAGANRIRCEGLRSPALSALARSPVVTSAHATPPCDRVGIRTTASWGRRSSCIGSGGRDGCHGVASARDGVGGARRGRRQQARDDRVEEGRSRRRRSTPATRARRGGTPSPSRPSPGWRRVPPGSSPPARPRSTTRSPPATCRRRCSRATPDARSAQSGRAGRGRARSARPRGRTGARATARRAP